MSERALKEIQKKGVFGNDKIGSLGLCKNYLLTKAFKLKFEIAIYFKLNFEIAIYTNKDELGYIHFDLWRLTQVTSSGSRTYFLFFIDDFSRIVWVYVLKSKNDVHKV